MSTVSRILPQRRRSTFGCELRETNPCLLVLVYLISLSFACETSFLGFELDLLTHEFLMSFVCWISTLRNPWYLYFSSIYFSYTDSCSFFSGCSYPETPVIAPDTPDHKTRSIRAYTRSIRAESASDGFLSVFELQIAYSPPSSHLKVLSSLNPTKYFLA